MPAASRTLPPRNGRGADARSQKRPDFAGQRNRPHRHGCQDDPLSSSRGRRVYLRMLRRFPCSIAQKSNEEGDSPIQSCCGEKRAMVSSLYSIVAVCKNMGIGKDGRLPWPPLRYSPASFLLSRALPRREKPQFPACIACLALEVVLNDLSEWECV